MLKIQPTLFQVVTKTVTTEAVADLGVISFLELSQPQMQHVLSAALTGCSGSLSGCCLSAILQTTVDHHTHHFQLVLECA